MDQKMLPNDAAILRDQLVDSIKHHFTKLSPEIEQAFRSTERHLFLPGIPLAEAYGDNAIVTQRVNSVSTSSSSQPSLMAIMLQQLSLEPGNRVLEIGAGTGFNAALMGKLVGDGGKVTTIEIDADIADTARKAISDAGLRNVNVIHGDGRRGYAPDGPYDRIILTAAARQFSAAWWDQLAQGGVLVGPLFLRNVQWGSCLRKTGDALVNEGFMVVAFMSLRNENDNGDGVGPDSIFRFDNADSGFDSAHVSHLLNQPGKATGSGLSGTLWDFYFLQLWLAIRSPQSCSLWTLPEGRTPPGLFPGTLQAGRCSEAEAFGCISSTELCLIGPPPVESLKPGAQCEITLHQYGSGRELRDEVMSEIANWNQRGRGLTKPPKMRLVRGGGITAAAEAAYKVKQGEFTWLIDWI
jgi:protein-L-isoaspartate(D-aspartate) O-methyltransferase